MKTTGISLIRLAKPRSSHYPFNNSHDELKKIIRGVYNRQMCIIFADMKKRIKKIELSPAEIEKLSRKLEEKSLIDKDYETLQAMLEVILTLNDVVRQKDVSIKRLLKRIFGIKTEKRSKIINDEDKPQDDTSTSSKDEKEKNTNSSQNPSPSPDSAAPQDSPQDDEATGKPSRKGHGRRKVSEFTGAKKEQIKHPDLKDGDNCPKCLKGRVYEQDPGLTLFFTGSAPLAGTIFECEKLRCNLCGEIFTAEIADGNITGQRDYDASAKAAIPVYKYGFGMPFHRLAELEKMVGIPLSASTLWDKTEELANTVSPVYEELVRQAAQAKCFHNDDTTMPILSLMKENEGKTDKERTGMFTTGIVAVLEDDTEIVLFFTGRNHAGENLDKLQTQRDPDQGIPIQMSDALSRNTSEIFKRNIGFCLSHARRAFVDIISIFPDECKLVIDKLADIYRNDAIAKDKGMSDDERLAYHQKHSESVMQDLHDWMTEQFEQKQVEPNSVLGGAIGYFKKHWEAFTLFLRVPGAPLDNNICERALKRAILNRKNAMFYKNEVGAWIGDMFMAIIHTCSLNKINPMDYLVTIQKYEEHMKQSPEQWMPWNYQETVSKIDV